MKKLIEAIDGLPLIVKIILCLFGIDIVWAIYRIVKGIVKGSLFLVVIGIVWIIGACTVTWVIDLVTVILFGKPILS